MAAPRKPADKIGKGLALPFRFLGGAGFATVEGVGVVLAQIDLVMGEECAASESVGTLVYNQAIGTLVQRLRHKSTSSPATEEMAVYYVLSKTRRLIPLARVRKMKFTPDSRRKRVILEIGCDILDRAGGSPIASGQTATVTI